MQIWEIIAQLCQKVIEERTVMLNIHIDNTGMDIQLIPYDEEEEDEKNV